MVNPNNGNIFACEQIKLVYFVDCQDFFKSTFHYDSLSKKKGKQKTWGSPVDAIMLCMILPNGNE